MGEYFIYILIFILMHVLDKYKLRSLNGLHESLAVRMNVYISDTIRTRGTKVNEYLSYYYTYINFIQTFDHAPLNHSKMNC